MLADWVPIAVSLGALVLSFLSYRATRWRQRAADVTIAAREERVPVADLPGEVSDLCIYVVNRGEHDASEVRVLLHRSTGPYVYEEIPTVVAHDRYRLTCWPDADGPSAEPVPFTMTLTWADGRRGRQQRVVDVTYIEH